MLSLFAQTLTVNLSRRVTPGPQGPRSKNLKLGFMAFSATSDTYTGSFWSSMCSEKNVSAIQPAVMSSSLFWRVNGLALVHSSVDRRRMPLVGLTGRVGVAGLRRLPWSKRSSSWTLLRSLDDRDWVSDLLSRSVNVLVGDLSALGSASSSIVFPRDLVGASVNVRLRMVMPCRCLSLRFYSGQNR